VKVDQFDDHLFWGEHRGNKRRKEFVVEEEPAEFQMEDADLDDADLYGDFPILFDRDVVQENAGTNNYTTKELNLEVVSLGELKTILDDENAARDFSHLRNDFLEMAVDLRLSNRQKLRLFKFIKDRFDCRECGKECKHLPTEETLQSRNDGYLKVPILYKTVGGRRDCVRYGFLTNILDIYNEWLQDKSILDSLALSSDVESKCKYARGKNFKKVCDALPAGTKPLGLAVYTDNTHVVHMGQRTLWPIYVYIANSTKSEISTSRLVGYVPILNGKEDSENYSDARLRAIRLAGYHAIMYAICRSGRLYEDQPEIKIGNSTYRCFVAVFKCDSKDQTKISGAYESEKSCLHCTFSSDNSADLDKNIKIEPFTERLRRAMVFQEDIAAFPNNSKQSKAALKELKMHPVARFVVGLSFFDIATGTGPCRLHILDINWNKKLLKYIGMFLYENDPVKKSKSGRKGKDATLRWCMDFNDNMVMCGGEYVFKTTGELDMKRKTGADLRSVVRLVPFALLGVIEEKDKWLIHFTRKWAEFSDLCRNVAVGDDLDKLDDLAKTVIVGFLRLSGEVLEKPKTTSKSLHQLRHFREMVENYGSLTLVATDHMERIHSYPKYVFLHSTNGATEENELIPQMMNEAYMQRFNPFPSVDHENEPALIRPSYAEPSIVGPKAGKCIDDFAESICDGGINISAEHVVPLLRERLQANDLHSGSSLLSNTNVDVYELKYSGGNGIKCHRGWGRCGGYERCVLQVGADTYLYLISAFRALDTSSLPPILLYCKKFSKYHAEKWICPDFELPVMKDSLPKDRTSSFIIIEPKEITEIWSLIEIESVKEGEKCFYADYY
jgi:hypothetical protein